MSFDDIFEHEEKLFSQVTPKNTAENENFPVDTDGFSENPHT